MSSANSTMPRPASPTLTRPQLIGQELSGLHTSGRKLPRVPHHFAIRIHSTRNSVAPNASHSAAMKALLTVGQQFFRRNTLPRLYNQHRYKATSGPAWTPAASREKGQALRQGRLFHSEDPSSCVVDPIQLRLRCNCEQCVDPSDGQKNYSLAYIPETIAVQSYEVKENGDYLIRWKNDVPGFSDDHISTYTNAQITLSNLAERSLLQRHQRLWDRSSFRIHEHTIDYNDYMQQDSALAEALHHLWEKGLVFISNVPSEESSVQTLAERIALLRNTFYKPTWDVRSKPNAENVAYTSRYLGFHMDLLYMKEPPGLQFLHCIENTCEGGESAFADTFQALARLEARNERLAEDLTRLKVPYGYRNGPHTYQDTKFVVSVRHDVNDRRSKADAQPGSKRIQSGTTAQATRVYWSPPFVKQDEIWATNSRPLREEQPALKAFADVLEEEDLRVETKLPAGTCAIFDNLRVVHARKAFDTNSGHRWLRGAYLDSQDFMSKAQSMIPLMPPDSISHWSGAKRLSGIKRVNLESVNSEENS